MKRTLVSPEVPKLGHRYQWTQDNRPLVASSNRRDRAIARVNAKRATGEYEETSMPCPCGGAADEVLATRDRYGIPVQTMICRNCGVVRINPIMTDAAYARYYDEEYLDLKTQEVYESDRARVEALHASEILYAKRIHDFVSHAPHSLGDFDGGLKLADVGCGSGGMVGYFRERGWQGAGCDYDSASLDFGRARGLDLHVGNATTLAGGAPFDLVILSHVFEHVVSPYYMLNQLKPLMKPGSLLYIELPGILDVSMPRYRNDFLRYLRFHHTYNYSLATLTNVVESSGFRLLRGTEWIFAAFEYQGTQPQPMKSRPGDYENIMAYLQQIERRRLLSPAYSAYLCSRSWTVNALHAVGLKKPVRAIVRKLRNTK